MKAIALTLAALAASALPAAALAVTPLGQVILGETRLQGEKIGEFSALLRAPDGQGVLAVSDRGYLARLDLQVSDGRLTGVTPVALHLLTGPDGTALRDQGFNPEGAALLADGSIAIVSEKGPRLAVFDSQGKWLRDEPLPEPLRDASKQASKKDGIESLGWTEATGFLAMTEEPQAGQPRDRHALFSTRAGAASFSTGAADSVSIKGMETLDDRLFILERTKDDVTEAMAPWLRVIDLPACLAGQDCTGTQLAIPVSDLADADFEGLAALEDGHFLMVSDDKIAGDLRSAFVLFRLE
ncbi:esterase-like activity of phytase family protein [Paracoccus sp. (in: a-proteobacteria)]|uniref:esterase-like activity of phytase family protein n=1 Tax=Paracoccus sp. TaxID=267 RepID=UPI003220086A